MSTGEEYQHNLPAVPEQDPGELARPDVGSDVTRATQAGSGVELRLPIGHSLMGPMPLGTDPAIIKAELDAQLEELRLLHKMIDAGEARRLYLRAAYTARMMHAAGEPIPPGDIPWPVAQQPGPTRIEHGSARVIDHGEETVVIRSDEPASAPAEFGGFFGERNGTEDEQVQAPVASRAPAAAGALATRPPLRLREAAEIDLIDPELAAMIHTAFAGYEDGRSWTLLEMQLLLTIQDLTPEELAGYQEELLNDLRAAELQTSADEEREPAEVRLLPLNPELVARMRRLVEAETDPERRDLVRNLLETNIQRTIQLLTADADATTETLERTLRSLKRGHPDAGTQGGAGLYEGASPDAAPHQPTVKVYELPPDEQHRLHLIGEEFGKLSDKERMSLGYGEQMRFATERAEARLARKAQAAAAAEAADPGTAAAMGHTEQLPFVDPALARSNAPTPHQDLPAVEPPPKALKLLPGKRELSSKR